MLYVFDVDKTLAESDCKMLPDMEQAFLTWSEGKAYFFVSGSAIDKMREQIPASIIDKSASLFPTLGAQQWSAGGKEIVKQSKFIAPNELREDLERFLTESKYEVRVGDHIQDRGTMWCFSVVGKNATQPERKAYTAYDNQAQERAAIAKELADKYPQLNFSIGGQISIDISEEGNDKSQVLPILREMYGNEPITFTGDRMDENGNDYPLAKVLREENYSTDIKNKVVTITSPEEVLELIRSNAL